MTDARVCIAQVFEIRNYDPRAGVVVLDVRNAAKEADGVAFTRIGMSVPCWGMLTGRAPVVGDTFKIVTSPGEWKPWPGP